MPYFTLQYFSPLSPGDLPSFIITESKSPFNFSKLQELTNLAQLILHNHLKCSHVPSSFHLDPNNHRNALSLLEFVIFSALQSLSHTLITPQTQSLIEKLENTINQCFNVSEPLLFEQSLPVIMDTPLTLEQPSTSFASSPTQHTQKRSLSPSPLHSSTKHIRLDLSTNNFTKDLSPMLNPFSMVDDPLIDVDTENSPTPSLSIPSFDEFSRRSPFCPINPPLVNGGTENFPLPLRSPLLSTPSFEEASSRSPFQRMDTPLIDDGTENFPLPLKSPLLSIPSFEEASSTSPFRRMDTPSVNIDIENFPSSLSIPSLSIPSFEESNSQNPFRAIDTPLVDVDTENLPSPLSIPSLPTPSFEEASSKSPFRATDTPLVDVDTKNLPSPLSIPSLPTPFFEEANSKSPFRATDRPLFGVGTDLPIFSNSFTLPVIHIISQDTRFIIKNQTVTNLSLYFSHLHNGIDYVLNKNIYFLDPSVSPLSEASLYNSSLIKLLQLLYTQQSLLNDISCHYDQLELTTNHTAQIDNIKSCLKEAGFSDYSLKAIYDKTFSKEKSPTIAPIKSPFNEKLHSESNSQPSKSSITSEASPLNPLFPFSNKLPLSPFLTDASDNENPSTPESSKFFIHLSINKQYNCNISLKKKKQKISIFLNQIEIMLNKGVSYTCTKPLKEIPLNYSESREEILKALYILIKKNFLLHMSSKYLHASTYKKINILLASINKAFCIMTNEPLNASYHSKKLVGNYENNTILAEKSTHPTCHFTPIFFIKKNSSTTNSCYHISYTTKRNKKIKNLFMLVHEVLKKLSNKIELMLQDTSTPIFYLPFNPLEKKKIKITTKEELLLILHQGIQENKLYFKKNYPSQLLTDAYNPSTVLDQAITSIQAAAHSVVDLPIITEPLILEEIQQFTRQAIIKKSLEEQQPTSLIVKKASDLKKTTTTCLFVIKNTHISSGHLLSSYKIFYTTKNSRKNKSAQLSALRITLSGSLAHAKFLCDNDLSMNKIKYVTPFTNKEIVITNKKYLYQILFQGFQENMFFLSKKEPSLLLNKPTNAISKLHKEIIQLLTSKLDGEIPVLNSPSILEEMTAQQQELSVKKVNIPPLTQSCPEKNSTATTSFQDIPSPESPSSTSSMIQKDNSSQQVDSLLTHLSPENNSTKPLTTLTSMNMPKIRKQNGIVYYVTPFFSIKKQCSPSSSILHYHLSYFMKYSSTVRHLKRSILDGTLALIEHAQNLIKNPQDHYYVIFVLYNQKEEKIINSSELFKILHTGISEFFIYYKSNYASVVASKEIDDALNNIKNLINTITKHAVQASLILPSITTATTLEKILTDTQNDPELLRTKAVKKIPSIFSKSTLQLPVFMIQYSRWTSSKIANHFGAKYTIKFHLKKSTATQHIFTFQLRNSLIKMAKIITRICKENNPHDLFSFNNFLTEENQSLNRKECLILIYQGITQLLIFIKEQAPGLLKKTKKNDPEKILKNALTLIISQIGPVPNNASTYEMLSLMLSAFSNQPSSPIEQNDSSSENK
ncbi:hypothetical protein CLAVI_000934 [Candidatus Clavichlamydia salmonicola]|uniref:hypothetical protein n=1 Tax=Candidatus Clavichlamydia salmonicola TaxID=469812 RepID=UPI0018911F3C|nr:hypothetical protein [Candidatus Clavichlamydia salmonicola]MBF5051293.1 hypothetical protein [Candidatus Clavichlamydia salmonicola]